MHWSEEIAEKIIARNPNKEEYVCAAGISPSGSIHIGNFRDIATSLFVVKALEKKGIDAQMFDALKGNTALMLSNTGNAPAKLIKEILKKEKGKQDVKPQLKAAYVEETVYMGAENLELLSAIKSKNELIADVIALLQSPAKNVISALQSGATTIHGVLTTLGEREEA